MTDLFLKDEGDLMTICFQTSKAINVLNKQPDFVRNAAYGDESYKKIDTNIGQKNRIISFAGYHNLSIGMNF